MNSGRAKWIRKLIGMQNTQLLLIIRDKYGEKTTSMSYPQIVKAAKKLWKERAPGMEKLPKRKELYEKKHT
ncbi:MAG: hypothetical protein PVG65_01955 [Candidatus Thorarchaeota archaeon]|jgi:hypothetical protein